MDAQKQLEPLRFEEFASHLNTIFDQVESGGTGVTVERGGRLFTLTPQQRGSAGRARRRLTHGDALWNIVGIGDSGEPNNEVARNKYLYMAEAIAAHGQPDAHVQPASPVDASELQDDTDDTAMGHDEKPSTSSQQS